MTSPRTLMVIILAGALTVACGRTDDKHRAGQPPPVGTSGSGSAMNVASALDGTPPVFVARDKEGLRLWNLTKEFYQKRENAPAWIENRKPRPQMDQLIDALRHADREGLDPDLYNAATLAARREQARRGFLTMQGFDEQEAIDLDVWLTYLYVEYASDLAGGLANLAHADPAWQIKDSNTDVLALLDQALADGRVADSLASLTP